MPGLELLSNSVFQILLTAVAAALVGGVLYVLVNAQGKVTEAAPVSGKSFSAVSKAEKKKAPAARTPKASAVFTGKADAQWASASGGVPQITIGAPKKTTAQQESSKPRRAAAETPKTPSAPAAAAPATAVASPTSAKKDARKDTKAASPKAASAAKEATPAPAPAQPKASKKKDGFEVVERKKKDTAKKDTAEDRTPVGEPSVLDLIFASSKGGSGGRGGGASYRPRGPISPVNQPTAPAARSATVVVSEAAAASTRGWAKIDADAPAADVSA